MLHKPISAKDFQLCVNAPILIFLILHKIISGILAKKTLTKAKVIGS